MDVPELGERTSTQLIGYGFYISLETNVRDDYLRRAVTDALSDHLREWCQGWTEAQVEDDAPRFIRFAAMVGPFPSRRDTWTERNRPHAEPGDYERIDDPYDMESRHQYEKDHEDKPKSTREPGY